MKKETLQNLLHRFSPEWDESIFKNRKELGFSFDLDERQCWDWFASGKHIDVRQLARREVENLRLPAQLAEYWICCFYSNYHEPNGIMDLTKIKGPPFLVIPCPSSFLGEDWMASVSKARSETMREKGLKQESDLIRWFWGLEAASEVGALAFKTVQSLCLPESFAMSWVCCFLPEGAKWMIDRVVPILKRFPQFAYRRQCTCTGEYQRTGVRAYPFVIDWAEGADDKYRKEPTMWDLLERGMNLSMDADSRGNTTITLSWRPELVGVSELRMAVEYAQRYCREGRGLFKQQSTPLRSLIGQFVHKAKVIPPGQRKQSAQARHQAGEATFEQLLCEEALTPEVQEKYQEYVLTYQKSPARRNSALRDIRLLRKEVYDRVRVWLVEKEQAPKVQKSPPWWSQVLPQP